MSERALLYNLLRVNAGVQAVFDNRIIDSSALGAGEGQAPPFPYLVTKYGESVPGANRTSRVHTVELWAYDEPGDYTRLQKGLDACWAVLHEQTGGSATADGVTTWRMWSQWQSTSRDLTDDVLRAVVRYSTYRLVTNTQ